MGGGGLLVTNLKNIYIVETTLFQSEIRLLIIYFFRSSFGSESGSYPDLGKIFWSFRTRIRNNADPQHYVFRSTSGRLPKDNVIRIRILNTCSLFFIFSTCQQPGCEAGIREDTFDPVEHGAGLRLHAECNIGSAGQSYITSFWVLIFENDVNVASKSNKQNVMDPQHCILMTNEYTVRKISM
jgi:hypothetical protein